MIKFKEEEDAALLQARLEQEKIWNPSVEIDGAGFTLPKSANPEPVSNTERVVIKEESKSQFGHAQVEHQPRGNDKEKFASKQQDRLKQVVRTS